MYTALQICSTGAVETMTNLLSPLPLKEVRIADLIPNVSGDTLCNLQFFAPWHVLGAEGATNCTTSRVY
jgi:hypothetical protein